MMRGVMLPPIGTKRESNGSTGFFTIGDLPFLSAVPAAILYWDKIYAPIAVKGMVPQYDEAVQALVDLGVAESLDLNPVNYLSDSAIQSMVSKYADSLKELDARPSEIWSVMPMHPDQESTLASQSSPYLPKSADTIASIEVQLRNALPVPDRDVPYEDLIEFKNSRRDQIQKLHAELSQVASRYVDRMDDEKALSFALNDVHLAISELQRVYEERWVKKTTRNLTTAFAVDGILPSGVAYLSGVEIDTAFLIGAGTAIVKSAVSSGLSRKLKDHPYAYALHAGKV